MLAHLPGGGRREGNVLVQIFFQTKISSYRVILIKASFGKLDIQEPYQPKKLKKKHDLKIIFMQK